MADPTCSRGCRMIPVVPNLWLCEHAAYGSLANLKGAEDEARRLLARAGGYHRLRAELDDRAKKAYQARLDAKAEARTAMRRRVKEHA